jgi:hypothetical protein
MFELYNRVMTRMGAHLTSRWSVSLSRPDLRIPSPLGYLMGVAFVLIVTLALMEPASSAGLNLLSRTLFFSLHLVPGTMIAWLLSGWLFNLRVSRRLSPWTLLVIAGAVTGVLLAPVSVMLELLFGVVDATDPQSRPLSFTSADWLNELKDELQDVPLITAVVWPAMNAFVVWRVGSVRDDVLCDRTNEILSPGRSVAPHVQLPSAVSTEAIVARSETRDLKSAPKRTQSKIPGLLDRLPTRLGRDIVFIEAQEHYLRVVTNCGEHLLLQGLTHAIAELEENGFSGVQIHRSVWVAWKHVEDVDMQTGATSVILSTGVALKIGRRRVKLVLDSWRQRFM